MVAARRSHLVATVWPALNAGQWVVCDRFADSTVAYQGYGGGVPREQLVSLHRLIADDFTPDLTLILDLPVEIGLKRAARRRGGEMRFEAKGQAFHERVRQGFLAIAAAAPERCVVIDATRDIAMIAADIRAAVSARLGVTF
jgi:dTMP kinase